MIAIIDYGAGNIRSVEKALVHIGCRVTVTRDPQTLLAADAAVLPGVGSFGDAMQELRARGLEAPIRAFIASGRPFLGICLGLQILFESSEESPGVAGLGLLRGKIVRIPAGEGLKIPRYPPAARPVCPYSGRAVRLLRPLVLPEGRRGHRDRNGVVRRDDRRGSAEGQPPCLPVPPGKERGRRHRAAPQFCRDGGGRGT